MQKLLKLLSNLPIFTIVTLAISSAMIFSGCHKFITRYQDGEHVGDFSTRRMNNNGATYPDKSIVGTYSVDIENFAFQREGESSCMVKYARVSGLNNQLLEKKANQSLKDLANWLVKNTEWAEDFNLTVKCRNARYVSVFYTTEWPKLPKYWGDIRFGVTIDLSTGDRVFLDSVVKNTRLLELRLTEFVPPEDNDFISSVTAANAKKIIHFGSLSEDDYVREEYGEDSAQGGLILGKPSFYVTDTQLVIIRDEWEDNDIVLDTAVLR